ncbi:hypothetical protein [Mycetocola zhujimingii]|uniref:hypothetical protein n=1 Tax=Mycetocola zhujimingii TaxID=2079792 RepID=UPI0013C501DC|nr:hypothetical protein [Mycetocola zhujimingii]
MERDDALSPVNAQEQLDALRADGAAVSTRTSAPLWYLVAQSLCIAGFVFSFSLDNWQSLGFVIAAVAMVLLGMLRPAITGTRAEPWVYRRSLTIGAAQLGFVVALVVLGPLLVSLADSAVLFGALLVVAFGGSLALGIAMERALARSIAEGE